MWKDYIKTGMLNEQKDVLKTIEGAVDYVLEKTKNKKDALKLVDSTKDAYIKKNSKKIKEMINKLPNNMF